MLMNDSTLLIYCLAAITLLTLLLLGLVLRVLVRTLMENHYEQVVENQRLRNQILAMGDLSALERLNRTTEVQRTGNEPSVSNDSRQQNTSIDPQDIINTPSGPVVMIDGVPTPLGALTDESLLAQGWADDGDVDFGVSPEGEYVSGRDE